MPDVVAIIPTFNRTEFLAESLQSVLGQTRVPDEVIVVDDGSTEDVPAVLAAFAGRVRYLRQDNGGKAAALNNALRRTDAGAVWIFDDDDIAEPDALKRLLGALEADDGAAFVVGGFVRFTDDGHGRRQTSAAIAPAFDAQDFFFRQLMAMSVFQGAMLVRRAAYDRVGQFDETLPRAQDYDMLLRLTRTCRAVEVPGTLFHQRTHTGHRGPAGVRIAGDDVWKRQVAYDARVLAKVADETAIADFLPRSEQSEPLPPRLHAKAMIRRAAAVGKRGLWDRAASDLADALELGGGDAFIEHTEWNALADLFALSGMTPDRSGIATVLRAIDGARNLRLRQELRQTLTSRLFMNVVKDLARSPGKAMVQAELYLKSTRGRFLIGHGWSALRWSAAFGWRHARCRLGLHT